MTRRSRSQLKKLSSHGFYALVVILFSQVAPSISLASVNSLYHKVRDQLDSAGIIGSAEVHALGGGEQVANWTPAQAPGRLMPSIANP